MPHRLRFSVKKSRFFYLAICFSFLSILILSVISFAATFSYNMQYDSNGNLIQDESLFYEYDSINQLIKVRQGDAKGEIISEYDYDSGGNRIKKTTYLNGKKKIVYQPSPEFVREIDENGNYIDTVYYYDSLSLIVKKDDNGTYFYHPNHLGSTELVTDSLGNVIERTFYEPFGAVLEGGKSRFLFTGKERDPETSLFYYGARYYN